MELLITVLKYIGLGFLGLIGSFILILVIFGKRIEKQWAVRADFKDTDGGNHIGKFEVAKQRVAGESDFSLKVKCKLHHAILRAGQPVRVMIDDITAMEAEVIQDGRLRLSNDAWTGSIDTPQPGSRVTVWVGGEALVSGELNTDFEQAASTVNDNAPVNIPRTARILRKSNAKLFGLGFIVFGLIAGYLAWRDGASPVVLGLIGLLPLTGFHFIRSNTTNILYMDNGRLGWYSRFNRQLHVDQVPVERIQSLKVKPYRFGRRHTHYQAVIGLVDGYEIPLPDNLLGANPVHYVEKRLLVELRSFKPSIEYIQEEPVQGRPVNRIRLPDHH